MQSSETIRPGRCAAGETSSLHRTGRGVHTPAGRIRATKTRRNWYNLESPAAPTPLSQEPKTMSTGAEKRFTEQEYLEFERQSDTKHEFFDGEIFAMAGGKMLHSLLGSNIVRELGNALKGRGRQVLGSDMKVQCPTGLFTYPDVSVVCSDPQMLDDHDDVLLNPVLIVEVFSKSTEQYDRGRKFANYKTITSLQEYVLVAQDKVLIDRFVRQADGTWEQTTLTDPSSTLQLPALECSVPVEEIYRGAKW